MSVRLGDICSFQSGGTPSKSKGEYYQGTIPWVTTVALNGGHINEKDAIEWITDAAIRESAAKIVPANSVMVGTRVGVGKVAINSVDMSTSQDIISLLNIDETAWDKDFLCRVIQGKSKYLNLQARGATIKGIKIETLAGLEVPEIPVSEQRRITSRIDKTACIIEKRYKQSGYLDTLIKARFVEMFGDPDLNKTMPGWKPISSIGTVIGGATPKTSIAEYWDGEYRWITPAELNNASWYIYDYERKITEEGVRSCSLVEMPIGTVLLSSRAPIGKVAIAGKTFYCNQGFKNIICGNEVHPVFLYSLLAMNSDYLNSLGRGATFKEISKSIVQDIMIPVPEYKKQTKFAEFCEQVDKSKVAA